MVGTFFVFDQDVPPTFCKRKWEVFSLIIRHLVSVAEKFILEYLILFYVQQGCLLPSF
ncbi:MAG: hypothetical protein RL151_634 [Bacteroidota bacterium]|jgi:hypothetical protein